VNPENKPTKVNWTLSWPSALEICGKLFFNKGLLISDLILLGTADNHVFFAEKMSSFFDLNIVFQKAWPPKISCHNSEPANQSMGSE